LPYAYAALVVAESEILGYTWFNNELGDSAMNNVSSASVQSQDTVTQRVRAAQNLLKHDRRRALDLLNALFREGMPPDPALDGRCAGQLVAVDIAPVLTPLTEALLSRWLPWKGKFFQAAQDQGDNIFVRSSKPLGRVLWPMYRDYRDDGSQTFRAFQFRTYVAPGRDDPDRQVLKIDYDLPANPRFTIRRVLDELVQVADNYYLGKAHLKWWWGRWQMVVYFALQREQ
jgi:hypothetical protein